MVSRDLTEFFKSWCSVDCDFAETKKAMQEGGVYFSTTIKHDFAEAIKAGSLTPENLEDLTGFVFKDKKDADEFLHERWNEWFPGEPYPIND